MQSANFNGSCKNDNFSVEIFCFVFLIFAQNIYCGHTLEQK